ncbi:MAG: ABC transporter permease [Clostridiales bacterium]|nr:ABC transporter permease [Clostridiales bacterium]
MFCLVLERNVRVKKYIANFMKYRYLLSELVKKDIKLKYRRSKLGILWTLLEPLLTMIVLSLVFSELKGNTDRTFPVYILTGRLLYTYFNNGTKVAARSIRSNSSMMRKVYIPKYMYPLSAILSNFVIFLISLIVLAGVSLVLRIKITFHIVEAIYPLVILFLLTLGVGMILATLEVFFRDLEYLWGVVLMIIMYCSAIFYPADMLKGNKSLILDMNPLYALIKNFRNAVLYGTGPDYGALAYASAFSVIALLIGIVAFYKKQDEFILNL